MFLLIGDKNDLKLIVMKLTITGYSTALFSTWYFVEELGLLLDAGDGLSAALLQKARKIKHVFISHPDRDHLTGLLQFGQLNARDGFPKIFYPKDSGSFPALANFMQQFDRHVEGTIWQGLDQYDEIYIKNNILVKSIRNEHIEAPKEIIKSLSFEVIEVKRKLKKAFLEKTADELQQIRQQEGKDYLTEEVRQSILSYSGDTPVRDFDRWKASKILIHEATFLEQPKQTGGRKKNEHSLLEEVIEMVAASEVEQLILGHFSSRYSPEQIDHAILDLREKYGLAIPIYRVLPGRIVRNILHSKHQL